MITTIEGIPVYRVLVDEERGDGMVRISLVDDPAVMSDFVAFDRREPERFAIQDEEKRIVRGVVARADFPVFRSDSKLGDYYVVFPPETIREMAEKYLTEGRADRVDADHDGKEQEGIHLVQWFIKDTAAGVNPSGFEDVADGSLFAEYHVENDDIWEAIKAGEFKGFSMEVFYTLRPEENAGKVREMVDDLDGMFERIISKLTSRQNMNRKQNLLRKLGRMLAQFATVTTDRGVLAWDGDEDLKAGDRVYIEDADGNRIEAEDGDYRTEDGKVVVVAEGVVAEIKDVEAEVDPAEEFGSKETDKGVLYWDGDEDLKEGDRVFVQNEEGEREDAPDGEYRTNDGKVISVVDGAVASIVDDEAEVADEPEEMSRHKRMAEIFEASYQEKEKAIYDALAESGLEFPYIVEAADDYAVVAVYEEGVDKYLRYEISFDEEGKCTLGESMEVKMMFVPMDFVSPFEKEQISEEEVEGLRKENEDLRSKVEELSRTPMADPAKKSVPEANFSPVGEKGKTRLAKYFGK